MKTSSRSTPKRRSAAARSRGRSAPSTLGWRHGWPDPVARSGGAVRPATRARYPALAHDLDRAVEVVGEDHRVIRTSGDGRDDERRNTEADRRGADPPRFRPGRQYGQRSLHPKLAEELRVDQFDHLGIECKLGQSHWIDRRLGISLELGGADQLRVDSRRFEAGVQGWHAGWIPAPAVLASTPRREDVEGFSHPAP
jgi:hypothetical protein